MSNILSFEFEELPLVISINGIEAALINGCAEIQYDRHGGWHVVSVSVEGHQQLTQEERAAGKRPWVYIAAPSDLAGLVENRLCDEWNDRVQDAINEQLASDREDAAEMRAEMRRDHMMGL
jgi:hypothetical protein